MTRTPPLVIVVQHERGTGPGWVGDWLVESGLRVEVVHAYAAEDVPPATTYDALVVLGGAMAPADDARCPWLPAVRDAMSDAVAARVPTLGICLGAQLLSLAMGGTVRRGVTGPELGVLDVDMLASAADDAVFGALAGPVPVVQWHWEEMADLPPDAVLLASSRSYAHQIFRVGDRAWGVQGHPEVTSAIAAAWAREDSPLLLAAGRQPDELVAEVRAHEPALEKTWRPVAAAFARVVHERAAQRPGH